MLDHPVAKTVVDALNAEQIPYLLAGSFSSNFYGIPRSTKDADFVIELSGKSVMSLVKHFPPEFHLDPQVRFESVTGTLRNVIDVTGTPFQVELFRLSTDPHDQERFRRRVAIASQDRTVYLPTAEDVVITKLRWALTLGRQKDLDDIRDVLSVRIAKLDWDYVDHWCDLHGTRDILSQIRSRLPSV